MRTRDEANTLAGSRLTAADGDKFALYLTSGYLFQHAGDVTIDDQTRIRYHTKEALETSGAEPSNVYVQLYTEPDDEDDRASWYGYRLTAEPYFALDLDAPGGEWVAWSTDAGEIG